MEQYLPSCRVSTSETVDVINTFWENNGVEKWEIFDTIISKVIRYVGGGILGIFF